MKSSRANARATAERRTPSMSGSCIPLRDYASVSLRGEAMAADSPGEEFAARQLPRRKGASFKAAASLAPTSTRDHGRVGACSLSRCLSAMGLVHHRAGLRAYQVGGVEAFGEPVVDFGEHLVGFVATNLSDPSPSTCPTALRGIRAELPSVGRSTDSLH